MPFKEQFIRPLMVQTIGSAAIAISKTWQITQMFSKSKIMLYRRKDSANNSTIAQITSNCVSFFFSGTDCSNQSLFDNIVNNLVVNRVK